MTVQACPPRRQAKKDLLLADGRNVCVQCKRRLEPGGYSRPPASWQMRPSKTDHELLAYEAERRALAQAESDRRLAGKTKQQIQEEIMQNRKRKVAAQNKTTPPTMCAKALCAGGMLEGAIICASPALVAWLEERAACSQWFACDLPSDADRSALLDAHPDAALYVFDGLLGSTLTGTWRLPTIAELEAIGKGEPLCE